MRGGCGLRLAPVPDGAPQERVCAAAHAGRSRDGHRRTDRLSKSPTRRPPGAFHGHHRTGRRGTGDWRTFDAPGLFPCRPDDETPRYGAARRRCSPNARLPRTARGEGAHRSRTRPHISSRSSASRVRETRGAAEIGRPASARRVARAKSNPQRRIRTGSAPGAAAPPWGFGRVIGAQRLVFRGTSPASAPARSTTPPRRSRPRPRRLHRFRGVRS